MTKFKKHEIEETLCDSASLETKKKKKKEREIKPFQGKTSSDTHERADIRV